MGIRVQLPRDRRGYGTLTLVDTQGVTVAGPFGVLGKADPTDASNHQNPGRSPLLRYGDTPTGIYRIGGFLGPKDAEDSRRHGPNGKIVLFPTSGDALVAKDGGGRIGLEIHGGYLRDGKLRPTNGCLRLRDDDMATLLAAIITAGSPPAFCGIKEIDVSVSQVGADAIEELDGDPPPDISGPTTPLPSPRP